MQDPSSQQAEPRPVGRLAGKVVIAAIAGIVVLIFSAELTWRHHAQRLAVRTCFHDAVPLKEGAPVLVAGVKVGYVTRLSTHPGNQTCAIEAEMVLDSAYQFTIPTDSTVSVSTRRPARRKPSSTLKTLLGRHSSREACLRASPESLPVLRQKPPGTVLITPLLHFRSRLRPGGWHTMNLRCRLRSRAGRHLITHIPQRQFMKRWVLVGGVVLWSWVAAWAMPMGTQARGVIPADIQQIISVDYRALKNSDTAMALKQQIEPDNLKQFEEALKGAGLDPEKNVEQLTVASYRNGKQTIKMIGVAQGDFPMKAFLKRMSLHKIKPVKIRNTNLWPMSGGLDMTFLDENTLLFGDRSAVQGALDARDGYSPTLDTNNTIADMMGSVDSGTVWSVLDQQGTQNMMRSALGDASQLGDFETVKKRLLGSRYQMNFSNGVNFDLDVLTADSITAATLSTLVKAGVLYKKLSATPAEKVALDSVTVDSESSNLQMHFKTDDKKFQSLMHSELFAAVSK